MTFPSPSGPTTTVYASGTSHLTTMPAAVNSGDLLLMAAMMFGPGASITTPSGWALVLGAALFTSRYAIYKKISDGTEAGTTPDVVTASATAGAAHVYRVTAWDGSLSSIEITSNGLSNNPPSLTPSWGALDTLWFAFDVGYNATVSAYPTNYTGGTNTGDFSPHGSVSSATRQLNATSEDPGAFTTSDANGQGYTLAVKPALAPFFLVNQELRSGGMQSLAGGMQ